MKFPVDIIKYGEKAILINWPNRIEEKISEELFLVKKYVQKEYIEDLVDVSNGYSSLLLYFKIEITTDFIKNLKKQLQSWELTKEEVSQKIREIPVCYEFDFGIDLKNFLKQKEISLEDFIELHTKPLYHVYGKGFLPGFLYLGSLDERLYLPRKKTPNLRIPKNSIAIGGKQTGIYPLESPGGWHILGRTPLSFFDIGNTPPTPINTGDKVSFFSITKEEFFKIENVKPAKSE